MNDPASTHGLWADLYNPDVSPAETDFTVLGVPYDGAASSRKGAAHGPERIRFWSSHLTPFSEDRTPLNIIRIADIGDIPISDQKSDFEIVREKVLSISNVPIVLGGDHSISIPVLHAQREKFNGKRLGLLWVDAHPDLCDEFLGSKLSHACTLRRALEFGYHPSDICLVGLRSWEDQEIDLIEKGGMNVYTAAKIAEHTMPVLVNEIRSKLSKCDAVHVSLDIDCLDPAFAPGTGIPDAGGLSTRDIINLLKNLQGLPLAGLDLVEVAPSLDPSEITVFGALKIIMEYVALFAREKIK